MKRFKLLLISCLVFVLSSCNFDFSLGSHTSSNNTSTTSSSQPSTDSSIDSSSESSTSDSTSNDNGRPTNGEEIVDFYAVNDLHGAVVENSQVNELGFAKTATYLKDQKNNNPDHTVILSIGDMWQGTYDVYHNKGEVVTEAMNDIGFDAMTLGNHDFDWGSQDIVNNEQMANFPFLGANIMKYPQVNEKSDLGGEYVLLERGHLKIGVIGVIGNQQMTSICSRLIEDIYFSDPTPIIESLSLKLRNELDADIVVLAIHAGQDEVDISIVDNQYVDAVFNAHTHQVEQQVINGVPFIQGGHNGKYVSHIQFAFDYATSQIRTEIHENVELESLNLSDDISVKNIIDQYKLASDFDGATDVGYANGNFERNFQLHNMVNYATAQLAISQGYDDLDFVMTNKPRDTIYGGQLKYLDLYKGLPFDNAFYIVLAKGSDLIVQAPHNKIYRINDYQEIDPNDYYQIATYDFLIFHQGMDKQFDYYVNFNPQTDIIGFLKDDNQQPICPRDVVKWFLNEQPAKTIFHDDVRYNNDRHGTSLTI